ncbi:MAG: helix-turn-helix transcriptional regulator [Clostridia bacterium]|nr:helix-turn-helix transcriptional regulator [Clostridia bacterium]
MDIIERIEKMRIERGWTMYRLSMESGVSQSTLATIQQRKTPPKMEILQDLCEAFGVTLAQFFLEDETVDILSSQEKQMLTAYRKLPKDKQEALLNLIED